MVSSTKRTALVIPAAMLLAIPAGLLVGPVGAIGVLILGVLAGWRLVPGFWKVLGTSVAAGAIAGLVVLGPGMRIGMRIVAILDPETTPEFTVGGTLFVVVMAGGIVGAVLAIFVMFSRQGLGLGALGASILLAAVSMGLFLIPAELRDELAANAAQWLGLASFLLPILLHGLASQAFYRRLSESRVGLLEPV